MAAGNSSGFNFMEPLSTKRPRVSSYVIEVMEPQIWENFPEDLFKDVLARLPFATIICFRTVCHQWNNLITCQSFSQNRAQVSHTNPWFYLTFRDDSYNVTFQKNNYKAVYDPFTKRWYYSDAFERLTLPVSSAGGLVCSFDFFNRKLYVGNPLTQSFKKLPVGSIKRWSYSGMTMNGSGGYKVLRFSRGREYEIYDSLTKNWGHLEKLPEFIKKEPNFIISKHVSIDDTLYFIMHVGRDYRIVSCNTSTGVWAQHLIQVALHSSFLRLVESDGQIMLVGMLKENDSRFLCIWEVQKVTFLLKEVDRFPCSESYGILRRLTCWGNKGLLLYYLRSDTMYHIVTYNIATRKWEKVCAPCRKKLPAKYSVFGTAFQPCLSAMP
ncbi:hypothetical protein TSUD_12440 [Trifolium subterraneum]|uniref:Uncharacterized protein n=1 Tax=Trifolium subterraneum TaxID=3900 RepID=A0A2Z6LPJ9_TRISU|nr:hypothetical protein TSUD_12440 [Trifolium subterraneum]